MSLVPISMVLIIVGIVVGLLVFFYPVSVMRMQVKFYEMINWRIEPISLQKEFKRTKYSGLYLVVLCLFASLYIKFFLMPQ
ncbi:MAG: hypothetical protein PHQ84_04455 [Candidatus Omnitrophica bacterium]|jgi:hypothetical protein|nr:hypothetical protein [Candidatus Omnitrophota bacterium]MDD5078239.1 hypothetical protein [Candidatus Omnitrophota bacterium]MDD5725100.1 hypothetical protein [Candidatus Omnitrophota bacterium]